MSERTGNTTSHAGSIRDEDEHHCDHAVCEPAIRDLEDNAFAHGPSGRFNANCAWLAIARLAHT